MHAISNTHRNKHTHTDTEWHQRHTDRTSIWCEFVDVCNIVYYENDYVCPYIRLFYSSSSFFPLLLSFSSIFLFASSTFVCVCLLRTIFAQCNCIAFWMFNFLLSRLASGIISTDDFITLVFVCLDLFSNKFDVTNCYYIYPRSMLILKRFFSAVFNQSPAKYNAKQDAHGSIQYKNHKKQLHLGKYRRLMLMIISTRLQSEFMAPPIFVRLRAMMRRYWYLFVKQIDKFESIQRIKSCDPSVS